MSESVLPMFSSRSFIVSGLTFRSFFFFLSLVLILFYFLYNFKYIKVYFHRPQEMGRNHRTISLPTKKKLHILVKCLS